MLPCGTGTPRTVTVEGGHDSTLGWCRSAAVTQSMRLL
jgi:hypothetical protein